MRLRFTDSRKTKLCRSLASPAIAAWSYDSLNTCRSMPSGAWKSSDVLDGAAIRRTLEAEFGPLTPVASPAFQPAGHGLRIRRRSRPNRSDQSHLAAILRRLRPPAAHRRGTGPELLILHGRVGRTRTAAQRRHRRPDCRLGPRLRVGQGPGAWHRLGRFRPA